MRIVIARVDQKIKNDLNEHLLGLSADYFTAQSTGTLISRVGSDPQYISGGLNAVNVAIRRPITLIFCFGYAVYLNWRLTIFTVVVVPLFALIFAYTGKHLRRYILKLQEINGLLFSTFQESFTGIRVIKMFRLEKYARKKFRENSEAYTTTLLKTAILEEASHPMVEFVIGFAVAGLVFFGGKQVLDDKMTPGDFFAFLATFAIMIDPLRTMNDLNLKMTAAGDRLRTNFRRL